MPSRPTRLTLALALLLPLTTLPAADAGPNALARWSGGAAAWDALAQRWADTGIGDDDLAPLREHPQFQRAMGGLAILQFQLGRPPLEFARDLLGGSAEIAVFGDAKPKDQRGEDEIVLLVATGDAELMASQEDRFRGSLSLLLGEKFVVDDAGDGPTTYAVDSKVFYGFRGGDLLVASTAERLRNCLGQAEGTSLLPAGHRFAAMLSDLGTATLKAVGDRKFLYRDNDGVLLPARTDNPGLSFIAGVLPAAAANAETLGFALSVQADALRLTARTDRIAEPLAEAVRETYLPTAEPGEPPAALLPGTVAAVTLRRDFQQFFRHRENLFAAKALPGFDELETGISTFLVGRSFAEDFLPALGHQIRFLVFEEPEPAESTDPRGLPPVRLPSAALMVRSPEPQELNDLLHVAFQSLVVVGNVERAKNNQTIYVPDVIPYAGGTIQYARPMTGGNDLTPSLADGLTPALARVGDWFVLTSSLDTCRRVIDRLREGPTADAADTEAAAEVPGGLFVFRHEPLLRLLDANLPFLVAQGIAEGKTADRAERDLALVRLALEQIGDARVVGLWRDGVYTLTLEAHR